MLWRMTCHGIYRALSSRIIRAARLASIIVGAFVLAEVMLGNAEASQTRNPSTP